MEAGFSCGRSRSRLPAPISRISPYSRANSGQGREPSRETRSWKAASAWGGSASSTSARASGSLHGSGDLLRPGMRVLALEVKVPEARDDAQQVRILGGEELEKIWHGKDMDILQGNWEWNELEF